jgi:hypothetical protein
MQLESTVPNLNCLPSYVVKSNIHNVDRQFTLYSPSNTSVYPFRGFLDYYTYQRGDCAFTNVQYKKGDEVVGTAGSA